MLIDIILMFAGTMASFFLYACILVGKKADERMENGDSKNE